MDTLFGIKHNVVVLASSAVEFSQTPVSFTPATDAVVVGKQSSICVVLAGNVPLKGFDEKAESLLNGTKISAVVTAGDGTTHEFGCQGNGWAMSGRVVPSNELTACVQPTCAKQALPNGLKVRSVSISSSVPLHALGAYWYSTAALDQNGN
jgi:hypothetical protein